MKTSTLRLLLPALLVVATVGCAQSQKLPPIAPKLQPFIDNHEIAGAVTLVEDKNHILDLSAVGDASIENHTPMKTDAIFWIASMTKPLTGASILMLQEQGKLNIEDPVAKYIPEFANIKTPSGKPALPPPTKRTTRPASSERTSTRLN
jgi:CubicO group peptidase (beta-lactamase class C family)